MLTGRPRKFPHPNDLWEACLEYFAWVEAHPLKEQKVFHHQGEITHTTVDRMRAMTIRSLCLFLEIDQSTFFEYAKRDGFSKVCAVVKDAIFDQKLIGAAANMLNASIIARDLGLADKREITGAGGGPIQQITKEMTPQEAAAAYADTLRGEDDG